MKVEDRRREILDAAEALFSEKGFDQASTGDILAAVGIARGTLYYHFRSKEDIMDALIERRCGLMLAKARGCAAEGGPAGERMMRAVAAMRAGRGDGEMMTHLHRPQNALMHQKIERIMLKEVPPILAGILADGIAQGEFDTPYPLEAMEMVFAFANTVFDGMEEMREADRARRVQAFIFHLERMLGARRGSLSYLTGMMGGGV